MPKTSILRLFSFSLSFSEPAPCDSFCLIPLTLALKIGLNIIISESNRSSKWIISLISHHYSQCWNVYCSCLLDVTINISETRNRKTSVLKMHLVRSSNTEGSALPQLSDKGRALYYIYFLLIDFKYSIHRSIWWNAIIRFGKQGKSRSTLDIIQG